MRFYRIPLACCVMLLFCHAAMGQIFLDGFETIPRPPVVLASVYDEGLVQPPMPAPNLVSSGGFEQAGDWVYCGAAAPLSDAAAPEGGSVLRLAGDGSDCVERLIVDNTDAAAVVPVSLDALSEFYTLSFKARIDSPLGGGDLTIEVSDQENAPEALFQFFVDSVSDRTRGWEQFKIIFSRESLESSVTTGGTLYLAFLAEGLTDQSILIDEVRLVNGAEALNGGTPMPPALRDVADRQRLLIERLDAPQLATVTQGGRNLVAYPVDLSGGSAPGWSTDQRLLLAQSTINPPADPVPDPSVIVAIGATLNEFDAFGENPTAVVAYPGDPGLYLGDGNSDNKEALDFEINQVDFAGTEGRYGVGLCAASRNFFGFTGVACFVDLRNRGDDASQLISDAQSPALRGDSVAFIRNDAIVLADRDGSNESVIYQGLALNTDLGRALAWSSDGARLAFAQTGNGFTRVEGERELVYAIKVVAPESGAVTTIATVDQGRLGRRLVWSGDDRFLFYSVTLASGLEQVWWLRVSDGATGPVTNVVPARLWGAAG